MDKENLEEKPTILSFKEKGSEILFWITNCNIHISKERLAEILIAYAGSSSECISLYDEKQYLQFGQDCFNASRKNNSEWYFKYKSFSDFMNSRNQGK